MDELPGGYSELVMKRRVGLPTVHLEVDFTAPLRFGDVARIELGVTRIGRSSCTLQTNISRNRDGTKVAAVRSVYVATDLSALRAIGIPDDMRRLLDGHTIRT
jgi:4-hydroxybenzoyl-CoA thioesterase